jgi:hypothetical protein
MVSPVVARWEPPASAGGSDLFSPDIYPKKTNGLQALRYVFLSILCGDSGKPIPQRPKAKELAPSMSGLCRPCAFPVLVFVVAMPACFAWDPSVCRARGAALKRC